MTLLFLALAALLKVAGDSPIRIGLAPRHWSTVVAGTGRLGLYGIEVNVYCQGEFGKLLGLYGVAFFCASHEWGVAVDAERIGAARAVGALS